MEKWIFGLYKHIIKFNTKAIDLMVINTKISDFVKSRGMAAKPEIYEKRVGIENDWAIV